MALFHVVSTFYMFQMANPPENSKELCGSFSFGGLLHWNPHCPGCKLFGILHFHLLSWALGLFNCGTTRQWQIITLFVQLTIWNNQPQFVTPEHQSNCSCISNSHMQKHMKNIIPFISFLLKEFLQFGSNGLRIPQNFSHAEWAAFRHPP